MQSARIIIGVFEICESQIIACNVPSAKKSSRTIVYTRETFSDSNVWLRESLHVLINKSVAIYGLYMLIFTVFAETEQERTLPWLNLEHADVVKPSSDISYNLSINITEMQNDCKTCQYIHITMKCIHACICICICIVYKSKLEIFYEKIELIHK